jgi:chloramphenicol 3-O phosphotransferase
MPAGRLVILNGAPRAGKSSIARALQQLAAVPWINLGVDVVVAATPERFRPGIGLRPGGERPDLEAFVATNYAALFDSHAAHLRAGLNVVADLGIHDDYSRPLGIYADALARLAGLDVLWVGVACPIEVIMARRNADPRGGHYVAGDGVPDPVRRWQQAVHAGKRYDLVVDGGSAPPAEGAAAILAALERQMPRATR